MSIPCSLPFGGGSGGFVIAAETRLAQVFRVARVLDWNYDGTTNFVEWSDNASYGGLWAMATSRKAFGTFSFAFDQFFYQHGRIEEGHSFLLLLVVANTIQNVGGVLVQVPLMMALAPALITRVGYICDVRDGRLVEGSAAFTSSGHPRQDRQVDVFPNSTLSGLKALIPNSILGRLQPAFGAAEGDPVSIELPFLPT